MIKLVVRLLALITAVLVIFIAVSRRAAVYQPQQTLSVLAQTYIPVHSGTPLRVPFLLASDGTPYGSKEFQGHWSIVFFGYTACPLVCPKTLSVLSAASRLPESGVGLGSTHPLFVSVDPEHDTPERLRAYLHHFDPHIVGLTGTREAIIEFAKEIGAGSQAIGSSAIDHSTSLFVVDPQGRLAGILLRPNKPAQIVADFSKVRLSAVSKSTAKAFD